MDTKLHLVTVCKILAKHSGDNTLIRHMINDMLFARLELNLILGTVSDMPNADTHSIPSVTSLLATMVTSGWVVSGRSGANIKIYDNVLKQMIKLNDCAKQSVFFLKHFDIVPDQDVVVIDMGTLVDHEYVIHPVRDERTFVSRPCKRKLDDMDDDEDHGCSSDTQKRFRF